MATEKLEALMRIVDRVPRTDRSKIDWLKRIGIDDDTSIEEFDKIETQLDGLTEGQKFTLFSVLDLKPTGGVDFFEELVNEILDRRWLVYPEIKTVDHLTYFLENEETPMPNMTREQLLKNVVDPKHGEKELADQKKRGRGGLSHNGWVCYLGK